ncbi:MAG: type II toxin-antitoxin system RelE/ParE family toxin [Thermoplasmata archaeon]
MRFKVTFAPTADQSFRSLPRRIQERFNELFDLVAQDPRHARPVLDVHQLFGYRNVWTLRIPPYRGIYAIDSGEVVFVIFGHRDLIYPQLHRLIPPRRQSLSRDVLARRH